MNIEGTITVDIERGHKAGVSLRSTRPRDVGAMFAGKTPEDVVHMVPLIFSICAGAQASAAASACEQAVGGDGEETSRRRARELIVLAENAREHCLRVLMDWRTNDAPPAQPETLRGIMALKDRMQAAAFGDTAPFQMFATPAVDAQAVEALAAMLDAVLAEHIFGEDPGTWLARTETADFNAWLADRRGSAARFLAALSQRSWQSVGRAETNFLPRTDAAIMWDTLQRDRDGDFTHQPQWQSRPCETGVMAKNARHPLVCGLIDIYGPGLLARHAARLVELAEIPATMRRAADEPVDGQTPVIHASRHGKGGMAEVETARGRLIHAIRLKGVDVLSYKILAPTEWNFHPHGAVVKALEQLSAEDDAEMKDQAEQVIRAIDPCVGFDVRVH